MNTEPSKEFLLPEAKDHHPACDWHIDQYLQECNCGAVLRAIHGDESTPDASLIERVAIAICPWSYGSVDLRKEVDVWGTMPEHIKSRYRDQANAAIDAIQRYQDRVLDDRCLLKDALHACEGLEDLEDCLNAALQVFKREIMGKTQHNQIAIDAKPDNNLRATAQPDETPDFDPAEARKALTDEARALLKQPLVQSLLYDIDLLPEQITNGRRWFYMLAVVAHMDQAMKRESLAGEWIDWKGGDCPVDQHAIVEIELRDTPVFFIGYAITWHWRHSLGKGDILRYRVLREATDDRVDSSDV